MDEIFVPGAVSLPTGVKEFSAIWETDQFIIGRYVAEVTFIDRDGILLAVDKTRFYLIPMWLILGLILVVIALFFALRARKL